MGSAVRAVVMASVACAACEGAQFRFAAATTIEVEPVYPAHADWNDYVRYGVRAADPFHQPAVACDGSEVGRDACVHGGELRRVDVPQRSSCSGLAIADALAVFAWTCQDAGGRVTFYSTGLASARGLGHLLDAGAFRPNVVTVSDEAGAVAESEPAVWGWTNPVAPLPDNATAEAVLLSDPGTIYVAAASRLSNGYNLAADRISVVTLPGATVTYGGSATPNADANTAELATVGLRTQLAAGGRVFLWIEGDFDALAATGVDAERNFLASGVRLSRVHRFNAARSLGTGVELRGGAAANLLTDVVVVDAGANGIDIGSEALNQYNSLHRIRVVGAGQIGVWARGGGFHRLTDVTASRCGDSGVFVSASNNQLFTIRASYNESHGLRMQGSNNVVVGAVVSGSLYSGVRQWGNVTAESVDNTMVNVVTIANGDSGIVVQVGSSGTYAHVTSLNNGYTGIELGGGTQVSDRHTVVNLVAVNAATYGLNLDGGLGSDNQRVYDVAAVHAGNTNLRARNAGHSFHGGLWVSEMSLNCDVGGAADRGLVQGSCTDSGADLSSAYTMLTTPGSDAVLHIQVNVGESLVGKVNAGDASNLSDDMGAATVTAISDWVSFDNRFRGWGRDGSAFPAADHQGRCDAATCRIWDARLRASDRRLLNVHGVFEPGALCPPSVSGGTAVVVTDQQATPNVFLAHAIEIVLDGTGDDDGLCESAEACIYTPNLGAYQGEGELLACSFTNGVVRDVSMFGYATNGVP